MFLFNIFLHLTAKLRNVSGMGLNVLMGLVGDGSQVLPFAVKILHQAEEGLGQKNQSNQVGQQAEAGSHIGEAAPQSLSLIHI